MCLFCDINSATKDFVLYGQKWGNDQLDGTPGGNVSFSFATQNNLGQLSNFDHFITDETYKSEIINSFSSWENAADIRFILSDDSFDVDIRIGWQEIDGSGGVLGRTIVPTTGPLSQTIVALDIDENWFVSGDAPSDKVDFSAVVMHEIGHAIGIDHSDQRNALMNASYSRTIFDLQQDDIDAAASLYGENDLVKIDVNRFYNPTLGGHFFTANDFEKTVVDQNDSFNREGVGFLAIDPQAMDEDGSVPVYRFYNPNLGSHLFTAFETEKEHLLGLGDFIFEGIGFRAFSEDSASTIPVHRFFNKFSGGHFFTANEIEKNAIIDFPELQYEGVAFYAF